MDLGPYADDIRNHLIIAADAGGEDARALAERLVAPLDSAAREVLDRLVVATQLRFPVIGDLARSVRFRWFDQPLVDADRAKSGELTRSRGLYDADRA